MTVHLVYKAGDRVSTPFAIGRELARRLAQDYDLKCYDPALRETIRPAPGDILIGHPGWDSRTIFQRSVREPGWARRIAIHPFCPADLENYAHLAFEVPLCDAFLAITGRVWIDRLPHTLFAPWSGKVVHLDLAVNQEHFPFLTGSQVAPAGKRRFLFVGNHPSYKNVGFLNRLAVAMPGVEFHRIGPSSRHFPNLCQHGAMDFSDRATLEFAASFDFMITPSERDANPTTILEAMALGLVPVAPEGSGYYESDGVINISGNDLAAAVRMIEHLQVLNASEILNIRRKNLCSLKSYYNWDRFYSQVKSVIDDRSSNDFSITSIRKIKMMSHYLTSSRSPFKISRLPRYFFSR